MKIIRQKNTSIVTHFLSDSTDIEITNLGVVGNTRISGINSNTHEILTVSSVPDIKVSGGYTWDNINGWKIHNNHLIIQKLKNDRLKELKTIYENKFYENSVVDGKEIQFRNESDRLNVTNAQQAALFLSQLDSNNKVTFRTADNINVEFLATDFVNLAMQVFNEKQQIRNKYWTLKDYIKNLEITEVNISVLQNFDVVSEWDTSA